MGNRCHCKKPATWMLWIVYRDSPNRTLASWATCDAHVTSAARMLREQHPELDPVETFMMIRQDG